jgi:5-methyltetrahydrofolate--homocysteine methyltransferase
MTRTEFAALAARKIIVLDGATGTELIKRGMPGGVSPEAWVLENPGAIEAVHRAYYAAGSDLVYVPSFGANRVKLAEFGLAGKTTEINRKLAAIARKNAGSRLIFGDLAPTGDFVEPVGEMAFEEAVSIYREQAAALLAGGVDGFAIETMLDVQEARAALIAIRELCELPVIVTLTFDEAGRTLTGCDAVSALVTMQALGADAFGCNCSTGPESMLKLIRAMKPFARIPLVAKPNAGMPKLIDFKTVFDLQPDPFAASVGAIIDAGAAIVGGCCGTTPAHLEALAAVAAARGPRPNPANVLCAVSSPRQYRILGPDRPFAVIGERINPTGKKQLQAELRDGVFDLAADFAMDQTEHGAALLDLNCGMPGIDEAATLRKLVGEVGRVSTLPLSIDTTNPAAAEAALRLYPGRALFNSISAERRRLEEVLPIVARYGAMPVVLPLTDDGIPDTLAGRIAALETIFAAVAAYGIRPEDCCVDALAMTASSGHHAAELALAVIDYAANTLKVNTVCGLSNISFGLPRRELVNAAFLGMALGRGLNMAIANPAAPLLGDLIAAADVLNGRDRKMTAYLGKYGAADGGRPAKAPDVPLSREEGIARAILQGDDDGIVPLLESALADGIEARQIVDELLVPAITEAGDNFEAKKFFLPQLVASAAAMRRAMEILNPRLAAAAAGEPVAPGRKIVLATVKGDIHDIGKNIVGLMLANHGFEVIDLGKDVPAETILDAVVAHDARLVGLSALMTTTMVEMDHVIKLAKARGLGHLQFIVGGAVLSDDYAEAIGARYAADALATVRLAKACLDEGKPD